MATTAAPYRLKPVKRADGMPYAGATSTYLIDPAGEATNLFNGQVVTIGADGYIALATGSGADVTTNNLGGSGIGAIGVFVGCEYQNAEGQQIFSQYYQQVQLMAALSRRTSLMIQTYCSKHSLMVLGRKQLLVLLRSLLQCNLLLLVTLQLVTQLQRWTLLSKLQLGRLRS